MNKIVLIMKIQNTAIHTLSTCIDIDPLAKAPHDAVLCRIEEESVVLQSRDVAMAQEGKRCTYPEGVARVLWLVWTALIATLLSTDQPKEHTLPLSHRQHIKSTLQESERGKRKHKACHESSSSVFSKT
jgi:hypothetical protein